jgi:hypothetical protein
MKAAPNIATPELNAIQCGGGCPPEKWITIHWKQSNTDEPIQSQFAINFLPAARAAANKLPSLFPQPLVEVNAAKRKRPANLRRMK